MENSTPTRSRLLEIIGLLAAVGFFVGIFFAWRTQMDSLVTQTQFDQLQQGQSRQDVERILGGPGTQQPPDADNSSAAHNTTLAWQNSSDSQIVCVFADDRLVSKKAMNLP
ncbi:MAG: outer membrane protein assembly factor BamE [Fuerstiella sp.]